MSHGHSHENTTPKPALIAAGAMVVMSLLMTTAVTLGFADRAAVPDIEREKANVSQVAARSLRFLDGEDGSVEISDAQSGKMVAVIETETKSGGFIRGVMRGLARERRMHGIGSEPPFALALWGDGSMSLTDSATGRKVELGAFGPDNREVFLKLFEESQAS
jgi:putative photosynthetic complex assembly protein